MDPSDTTPPKDTSSSGYPKKRTLSEVLNAEGTAKAGSAVVPEKNTPATAVPSASIPAPQLTSEPVSNLDKPDSTPGRTEVIVLDDVEGSAPNSEEVVAKPKTVHGPTITRNVDELAAKPYTDAMVRTAAGPSRAGPVRPPPRRKVPHLRKLPDINKCDCEYECGKLTQKERDVLTRYFEKDSRRIVTTLREGLSGLQLQAWSKEGSDDRDFLCYTLSVKKTFKCEDEFISHLLHNNDSGSPRMELCFDKYNKTHYLYFNTLPEKRTTMKLALYHLLGLQLRFYLYDA